MPILSITRDWADNPSIVRITTNDTLAIITSAGYLTAEASVIAKLNNGAFQWLPTDYVLIAYSGGEGFFMADTTVNFTFMQVSANAYIRVPMTSAQWLGMYAAPVAMIAAPGAGAIITVHSAIVEMEFVTTQYAAGGNVALQINNTNHGGGILETATVAAATVNGWAADSAIKVGGVLGNNAIANLQNVGLFISNDTAAFTTGDGTFAIHIYYSLFAIIP